MKLLNKVKKKILVLNTRAKANRASDVSWLDDEKLGTSLTNLIMIANKERIIH